MPYERKTADIHISEQLRNILEEMKNESEIAKNLLRRRVYIDILQEDFPNYIGVSTSDTSKISYLSKDRMNKLLENGSDVWSSSTRFHSKPGAFINKVFKDLKPVDVEKFSSLYRTFSKLNQHVFKIVDGDEIKTFYHYSSYYQDSGSLENSCMKHDHCQNYLNLYTENKEIVKMLVMLAPNGKMIGRSILWNFDGNKIMDRIYTIYDEEWRHLFIKWATDNGYKYKAEQNWRKTFTFRQKDKEFELKYGIQLKNFQFDSYPYLDTFKWLDSERGMLYNYRPDHFSSYDSHHRLISITGGGWESVNYLELDELRREYGYSGDMRSTIDDYGREIRTSVENLVNSYHYSSYILREEATYFDRIGDYIYKKFDRNSDAVKQLIKEEESKYDKIYHNNRFFPSFQL